MHDTKIVLTRENMETVCSTKNLFLLEKKLKQYA